MYKDMNSFLNEKLNLLDRFDPNSAQSAIICSYLQGVQDTLSLIEGQEQAAEFIATRISHTKISQFIK